ncbi:DUF2264 domain-containing protein [Jiangella alkaliphila]|uniref:DUF2264 domain-containing protein n=1 Tax=Jiangella alkaliphila TaxID=419479 RepID=A0A1H2LGF2_9ACTN|nr:DUF2264 domain-containing protein [Jiangella alkaliphila]SDU79922.1 hypothetical protein SAMN04488563_6088 [Jiangella alkaliphila]
MTTRPEGLRSRSDLQTAVRTWCSALLPKFSPGSARVRLGHTGASFDDAAAELEGFARPLWALAPLAAGGGAFDGWDRYREGLVNGTNPTHPEYWGPVTGTDQRMVEMAAIGFGLTMVPHELWNPLSGAERDRVADWLLRINDHPVVHNNWQFFRVLVNLGLARVGARHDTAKMHEALDIIETFAVDAGWYHDGPSGHGDWYIPWAMHFYGLIYARIAGDDDPARAGRFRDRAVAFAADHAHWFAADGSALPYGRSLTYRFAQSGFWGALAFADVEALPWGVVKGLALRNVRWWMRRPIFAPDGTLTLGYGYPNLHMTERYNSPGSPYWALKAAIPLAAPAGHPFWAAEEQPLPELAEVHPLPPAGMVVYRSPDSSHVVALVNGQTTGSLKHAAEKYAKFAYSTRFGFSVPAANHELAATAADSMLAISDDGKHYRVREDVHDASVAGSVLRSRWTPYEDVEIETWLTAVPPWHLRVHHVRTGRRLSTAEGGFATSRPDGTPAELDDAGPRHAVVRGAAGPSGIVDLTGTRAGQVISAEPNTNLLLPRTAIPTLVADLDPGEHWLSCAVLADPLPDPFEIAWAAGPPELTMIPGLPDQSSPGHRATSKS